MNESRNPKVAALMGGLCLVPFLAANAIVAKRIEPFFSMIRPGDHTSPFEYVLLSGVLACILLGAFIAARPLFDRSARPGRSTYVLNGSMSLALLAVFVVLTVALGDEIYRCNVLGIPNCD